MTTPSQESSATGLRLGFVPGVTLTKWRRIWTERFRRVPLTATEVAAADQRRVLDDADVDMCFVRLPIAADGLHVIPLYEEVAVAWMSKDHLLAALDEVSTADLADVRVIDDAEPESIELATYSAAVLRVPMSIARSGSRRDMVYRPVSDAAPTTVGLAWRQDNQNEWIDEFIGVVRGRTANSTRTTQQKADGKDPAQRARGVAAAKPQRPPGRPKRPRRR